MSDPGPGDAALVRVRQIDGRAGSIAVAAERPVEPQPVGRGLQLVLAEGSGKLAVIDIARVRQRLRHRKCAVLAHADDLLPADDRLAGAGIGLVLGGGVGFERCGARDELEDGAGRVGRVKEAVEVHAVIIAGLVARDIGDIVRVIARAGHGAEDLAGFVVIDAHRAVVAAEGLQRGHTGG